MALDGNDFKFDASRVYGGVSQIAGALDPCSMAIDLVGNTLGLPPSVRNVAKVGIGVVFVNPACVISGATGLAAEATKQEPATTEYCPPKSDGKGAVGCQGYASTSAPHKPTYGAIEAMSMNTPEFMAWVPSHPNLSRMRQLACNTKDPQCRAEYIARYQKELKNYIESDPKLAAEFEQHFGVMLTSSRGAADDELLIRRPQAQCSNSLRAQPHRVGSACGSNAGVGGTSSSSYGSASDAMDRMAGRLDTMQGEIEELLKKDELTQQDQIKLQRLMQKQQQLLTLLSTMMSIQNQMAMTAINNMKG